MNAAEYGIDLLVDRFADLDHIPSLREITSWLEEAEINDEEIAPYKTFSAEKYTRNRVYSNDFVEMIVIGWMPGQESFIHDHYGSNGAVKVFEGSVTETRYSFDEDHLLRVDSVSEASPGGILGVGDPEIHKLNNTSADSEKAVTIHVYAPPLVGLNVYKLGSGEVNYYRPEQ